jgi:hypothetical protein
MRKLNKRIDRVAESAKDIATRVTNNVIDGAATIVRKAEGLVESAELAAERTGHAAGSAAAGLETARVSMVKTRKSLRKMKK